MSHCIHSDHRDIPELIYDFIHQSYFSRIFDSQSSDFFPNKITQFVSYFHTKAEIVWKLLSQGH